jgi:anti-sigma B factor antagonist
MKILTLAGKLTIDQAADLKQMLLSALAGDEDLELNLADVVEVDTAGLQLLMMAKKLAQERGKALRLVALGPAVLELLAQLNLATYFDDPLPMAKRGPQ